VKGWRALPAREKTKEREAAFGRILKGFHFLLEKRKWSKENQCQRPLAAG